MSKLKKKSAKKKPEAINPLEKIPPLKQSLIALVIILIPLLYFYLPWELKHLEPVGSDFVASLGQTHLWTQWQNAHHETVLWNPNIFCGEPVYPHITPQILDVRTILDYLGKIFYWVFWQLLIGGLGIYYLLKYKKIPWYLAIVAAVAFVLLPDWMALVGEGHNSKLRAIMSLPWLLLSFNYLFDKKNWIGAGLFALTFSWLNRTHHFQIVFYGILVLFFLFIYPTLKLLFEKKFKEFGNLMLKLIVALALVFMTAAQPLFTTNEYAKYSTRGGNPVKLGKQAQTAQKAGGVSFQYATQWSYSPNELLAFFIPHFRGGLQQEPYDGTLYPQLRNRAVPGYWGEKPFNGNYASLSFILFLFAVIGAVYYRKNKFVTGLSVFVIFSVLLSFGRHFPELYSLFFYYLPYFAKFRAPAMILNVTFIAILLLSAFGLKALIRDITEKDFKWVLGIFGAGILVLAAVFLFRNSYAYVTPAEVKAYPPNTLQVIKNIRQEFLLTDLKREFIYIALASALLLAFLYKKIKVEFFVVFTLILASFETFVTTNRHYKQIQVSNKEKVEAFVFHNTPITEKLTKADKNYRAIVLGKNFTSNQYAYFYPLISGYSAIKLQLIQDLFDHNLYAGGSPDGINWKIVNMLSGRYVISSSSLKSPQLQVIATDPSSKETLYLNPDALPKAHFVKELKYFRTPEELVLFLNDEQFTPKNVAALIGKSGKFEKFSGKGKIKIVNYEPNKLELSVTADSTQFLTLAEMYYPRGWHAYLDGKEIKIYQVNHVMRGLKLPDGKHIVKLLFHPSTYFTSVTFVWIGDIITLLLIFAPLYFEKYGTKLKKFKSAKE